MRGHRARGSSYLDPLTTRVPSRPGPDADDDCGEWTPVTTYTGARDTVTDRGRGLDTRRRQNQVTDAWPKSLRA